jgi:uncharacterized protein (TIGR00369 family)
MPISALADSQAQRAGPLAGVKILDMSSVLLGPLATMLLADLGADVIKVESPRGSGGSTIAGDIWRYAGETPVEGLGPMFMALNRNKRAVALDLTLPEDRALFDRLVKWADVFIHNVRMAGMTRLGADYESIRKINPSIIYVHCAGFGQDGPYGPLSAYDDLIQAASGYTDLVARRDDGAPGYTPSAIADKVSGVFAANAVLAALFHRQRTGQGQQVQVPMLEAMTFFNMVEHLYGQTWKSVDGPMGYTRSLSPHRRPYATKDGCIAIVPYNERQWRTFLDLGGYPGLFESPKFSSYKARTENIGELYEYIAKAAVSKTTAEWLSLLQKADIPAIRCNSLREVLNDEHLVATGFFQQVEHPEGGPYLAMRHPVRYSETPAEIYRHAPRVGEHDAEIRARFGGGDAGGAGPKESREAKRTLLLRKILPLYGCIELTVDSLDGAVRCSVPLSPVNSNHFGAMHAGVLFSLAEATAASVFGLHKPFEKLVVIAKDVEIKYLRSAKSRIHAVARLTDSDAERLRVALAADPKTEWRVPVTLYNADEEVVADAVGTFVLRGA